MAQGKASLSSLQGSAGLWAGRNDSLDGCSTPLLHHGVTGWTGVVISVGAVCMRAIRSDPFSWWSNPIVSFIGSLRCVVLRWAAGRGPALVEGGSRNDGRSPCAAAGRCPPHLSFGVPGSAGKP